MDLLRLLAMAVSDVTLSRLCKQYSLVVPFVEDNLQGCSIDLTVGRQLKVENKPGQMLWRSVDMTDEGYALEPGEFVLGHTVETINVPSGYCPSLLLRSSAARAGFEHSLAGWCDAGFSGQLTVEVRNNLRHHSLLIKPGMRLFQLVVFKLDTEPLRVYGELGHGNYQDQTGATEGNGNLGAVAA